MRGNKHPTHVATNYQWAYAIGVAHLLIKYTTEKRISVFWSKVNKDGSIPLHCPELGQCWEWMGSLYPLGYGSFWNGAGGHSAAHRFAWELANGTIPDGLKVLHMCDNPKCCNPKHLFLGTQKDNVQDMLRKKRNHPVSQYGELHGMHKLTSEQVQYIRFRYSQGGISMKALGKEVGVCAQHICAIINGKKWGHLK